MLWTVQHRWPEGARFAFNCYWHWAQLLLCKPGELPDVEEEDVAGDEEEERGGIAARLENLSIETAVTEEEAAEGLAMTLEMQVEEDEGREGEEGGRRDSTDTGRP